MVFDVGRGDVVDVVVRSRRPYLLLSIAFLGTVLGSLSWPPPHAAPVSSFTIPVQSHTNPSAQGYGRCLPHSAARQAVGGYPRSLAVSGSREPRDLPHAGGARPCAAPARASSTEASLGFVPHAAFVSVMGLMVLVLWVHGALGHPLGAASKRVAWGWRLLYAVCVPRAVRALWTAPQEAYRRRRPPSGPAPMLCVASSDCFAVAATTGLIVDSDAGDSASRDGERHIFTGLVPRPTEVVSHALNFQTACGHSVTIKRGGGQSNADRLLITIKGPQLQANNKEWHRHTCQTKVDFDNPDDAVLVAAVEAAVIEAAEYLQLEPEALQQVESKRLRKRNGTQSGPVHSEGDTQQVVTLDFMDQASHRIARKPKAKEKSAVSRKYATKRKQRTKIKVVRPGFPTMNTVFGPDVQPRHV